MDKKPIFSCHLITYSTEHHALFDMPFFSNANHFGIHGGEMNDVHGNITKNVMNNGINVGAKNSELDCFAVRMWLIDLIDCRERQQQDPC